MGAADDVLAELHELAAACPRPGGTWHPGYGEIAAVFADFDRALAALDASSEARVALTRLLDRPAPPSAPAGPGLAAARERLARLARPEGRHPFLDTIAPTLEAMELVLTAVAAAPDAAAAFDAQAAGPRRATSS